MKKVTLLILIVLIAAPLVLARGPHDHQGRGSAGRGGGVPVAEMPYQDVDDTESADLVFMREEEKLARDVYRAMDDLWGMRIFRNIAGSEQTHMNAVLSLLDKYGIADPAAGEQPGSFTDPALQALYDQFVEQGGTSLIEALIVGATIEDLDIHDLQGTLARTDNEDIRTVYQNLMKGSRNHLRAFTGLLEDNDVSYEPQYIAVDEFEAIVSSPPERGRVDADGEPVSSLGSEGHRHGWRHRSER